MSMGLQLSEVFNLLPEAVCVFDSTGKILISNREFENRVISKQRGANFSFIDDLIHIQDKPNFLDVIQKSADGRLKQTTGPIRTLTSENSGDFPVYRRYFWSLSCELGSGKVIACGRIVNAIDYQENSGSEFIDFFQYAPTSLHWISPTGMIMWANNTDLEILGYGAEEYIGKHLSKFCPPEDESIITSVFASRTAKDKDVPIRFLTKKGEVKHRLLTSTQTDRQRYVFIRDASHGLSEAISVAERDAAQRVAFAKDECVLAAFSGIRTEMHTIKDVLGHLPKVNAEARELAMRVEHVTGVVEDMAFVTRCDSGKVLSIRPAPIQLETLIRDTYLGLSTFQKNKTTEIELNIQDVPEGLAADASLARVIHHLMSNAMTYSMANSAIQLSASVSLIQSPVSVAKISPSSAGRSSRGGRTLRADQSSNRRGLFQFRITNSVSSIMDLEKVHAAFQRYYAAQLIPVGSANGPVVRAQKGLGVGLNVAYNMVQMMGGMLECSATATESSFWFSLELSVGASPLAPKPPNKLLNGLGSGSDTVQRTDTQEWMPLNESAVANRFILDELGVGYVSPTDYSKRITLSTQSPSGKHGPSEGGSSEPPPSRQTRRCRILVVDDNTICQKVLMNTLKRLGIDSDVAGNGKEAVDKLTVIPLLFDAVLMDLHMPIMDGLTATRICRTELHLTLPIIVLTADVGTDGREENAIQAGVDVFLSKPATVNTLKEVLKQFNLA